MSEFKRIPPEQALALRAQGAVVVDIRDPQAFAAGHITGATHLDNHSVAEFIRNADLDAPTLVVCYHATPARAQPPTWSARASRTSTASMAASNCGAAPTRQKQPKAAPSNFFILTAARAPRGLRLT